MAGTFSDHHDNLDSERQMTEKKYISVKELASYLGVSVGTIYNWSWCGFLRKYRVKVGGALRFDIEKIKEILEKGKNGNSKEN